VRAGRGAEGGGEGEGAGAADAGPGDFIWRKIPNMTAWEASISNGDGKGGVRTLANACAAPAPVRSETPAAWWVLTRSARVSAGMPRHFERAVASGWIPAPARTDSAGKPILARG